MVGVPVISPVVVLNDNPTGKSELILKVELGVESIVGTKGLINIFCPNTLLPP